MDSGQSSSAEANADDVWAILVPADSRSPKVEIGDADAVVCSKTTAESSEKVAWCEIRRNAEMDGVATIRNLSPNAIIVDGNTVGEEAVDIKSGTTIIPGSNGEGYLTYTFEIKSYGNQDKRNIKIALDVEHAKCSICLNIWHDVVTVAPCLHNFCNGCFSEWLRRSITKSHNKTQSVGCPQCRETVHSVGKNHFLNNIEEAILQSFASLKRSDEEIALLETYASIKTNVVLGRQKNHSGKRPLSSSSDESDDADLPCPQCGTELGGFRCTPGASHLQCQGCGGMMPRRAIIGVPQQCLGCDKVCCAAYWHSQGVDSSQYNLICRQNTFIPISGRTISKLPDSTHQNNPYERDITERCIRQVGKNVQSVISEWMTKFDDKEIDRSRLQINHVESINSRTHLCNDCYDKFVDYLMYWFRVSMPRNLLPADAVDRSDCWYGYSCRTQHHNADHARNRNHVCRPTRGNP